MDSEPSLWPTLFHSSGRLKCAWFSTPRMTATKKPTATFPAPNECTPYETQPSFSQHIIPFGFMSPDRRCTMHMLNLEMSYQFCSLVALDTRSLKVENNGYCTQQENVALSLVSRSVVLWD